jgi:hypothetical protein
MNLIFHKRTQNSRIHDFLHTAGQVCALSILVVVVFCAASRGQTLTPKGSPNDAQTEPAFEATDTEQSGFFKRLFEAYRQDWKSSGEDGAEAPRRIPPPPLTSPPFPNADWNYGGSSVIGASNMTSSR